MTADIDELRYMVKKILDAYPEEKRWPTNIIDEVFQIIEKSFVYQVQYRQLVGKDKEGKYSVNPIIGRLVKEYTGLETLREGVPAVLSTLIETYSELG
jgi:hypothetical protein